MSARTARQKSLSISSITTIRSGAIHPLTTQPDRVRVEGGVALKSVHRIGGAPRAAAHPSLPIPPASAAPIRRRRLSGAASRSYGVARAATVAERPRAHTRARVACSDSYPNEEKQPATDTPQRGPKPAAVRVTCSEFFEPAAAIGESRNLDVAVADVSEDEDQKVAVAL